MTKIENQCCDCSAPGYPCRGSACPLRHVEVIYCDKCGEEVENPHEIDGEDLCDECYEDLLTGDEEE